MGIRGDLESNAFQIVQQEGKVQKIYPNDPCPCGSGKKYKCCGEMWYEFNCTWYQCYGMTLLMLAVDLYHERHDRHFEGDGIRLREKIDGGSFWKEWILVLLCVSVIVLFGVYGLGYVIQ